jgi:APA family basic amino acid/polyamine antiporter
VPAEERTLNACAATGSTPHLARRVGLFDATMIVMGGIVGSGIFMNPSVVARHVHTAGAILGAWVAGGLIALAGAFIYAELAARLPAAGGQYAYLREAFHPALGFLYGWVVLLVIQTGGMAAVAVTFAAYFLELTALPLAPQLVASVLLAGLAAVNCLGVRAGSGVQSAFMVLKIGVLLALIGGGFWFLLSHGGAAAPATPAPTVPPPASPPSPFALLTAFGAAMVPVLFAYGGWQTSNFVAEEIREPRKNLPRALIMGVVAVIALYLAVNYVCVRVLGPEALARTSTPASAVMQAAFGRAGGRWIAVGIAISTLGFLSQAMLTAPRLYFAMARDRLFFPAVAWIDPRRRVPSVAIVLQAVMAIVIAVSGRYEQILSYVIAMEFLFYALTAASLFVFRRRERVGGARAVVRAPGEAEAAAGPLLLRVPGHPVTTGLAVLVAATVVVNTAYKYPVNTGIGMAILLAGVPAYLLWSRGGAKPFAPGSDTARRPAPPPA